MINQVGLNTQPLKSDLHSVKNAPKHLSKIGFGSTVEEDEFETPSTKKEESTATPLEKGEFNYSRAARQFGKGFISPVTKMFSSIENFAITVGTGAVIAAIITASKKKAAPVIIAATALYGGINILSGLHKIVKNRGDHVKQEESFYDIGKGTGTVIISAIPAKGALQAAECKIAEDIHPIAALGRCIMESPRLLKESSREILSDAINLKNLLVGFIPGSANSGSSTANATAVSDSPSLDDPTGNIGCMFSSSEKKQDT